MIDAASRPRADVDMHTVCCDLVLSYLLYPAAVRRCAVMGELLVEMFELTDFFDMLKNIDYHELLDGVFELRFLLSGLGAILKSMWSAFGGALVR